MFEHRNEALLPRGQFMVRFLLHIFAAFGVVLGGLGIGVLGYHKLENLPWVDSLLNASMILGGMGPVNPVVTTAGKLFASAYALFSGLVFVVTCGVMFAPVAHRFLHRFHIELDEEDQTDV
jgi:hypothetical protein